MAITKVSRNLLSTGVSDSSDATAITINSSEQVGIGTTSPVATLQVKTQTNGNLAFQNSTSVSGGVKLNCFNDAANASSPFEIDGSSLQFNIAASEKMRIDSSGNVGIGVTSLSQKFEVNGNVGLTDNLGVGTGSSSPNSRLQIKKDGTGNYANQTFTNANSTAGITFGIAGSGTGNYLANNAFLLNTGSSAFIFGTGDVERMRIDSSGNVGIGTASPADLLHLVSSAPMLKVEATNDSSGFRIDVLGQSSGQAFRVLKDTSTTLFTVDTSGNVTAAGSISDERLKEDISLIDNPLDKIKELKGITYKLKESGYIGTGLIAQDLQKVLPEAVYEVNEPEKNDESYLAISYGNTVGLLVESIKEQQVIIEDLQTQINEVKNGN